jgi:hypothetical protein
MSHKAFYQTFYQAEQLFRFADDRLTFPADDTNVPAVVASAPVLIEESVAVAPVAAVPTVAIEDPILPPAPNVPEPVPVAPPTPANPVALRPATPMLSQKVLILVDEDLQPSEVLFLEKILNAVNLDVTGVDLLNVHGTNEIDFAEVLRGKAIHHFFTFGVPFTRLNLDILMDRYQPIRFEGITFLLADPLPAIETDVVLKKKLWEALKKIFLWR